ncbi:MAG: Ig-like domain-containing protein [Caldimonas sp.]
MHASPVTDPARPTRRRGAPLGAALAGLSLFIAGCGGGSGPGPAPGPAADSIAPTAQATTPTGSAGGVTTQTTVSVTFSEAMDATTLSAASFTLTAAGVPVPAAVSASGSTATLTPNAALAPGVVYTATVSTAAKDLAGNPLAAAFAWSFTTAASVVAQGWSLPVLLEGADGAARTPAVAATADTTATGAAQATAVWVQDGSVYMNRYQGGAWQLATLVENEATEATGPSVAMGKLGRTAIAWGYGFNGVYSVWGNVVDPIPPGGAGQDTTFARENARRISAGGNASSAHIAFGGGGYDAFAVWTEYISDRQPAAYHPVQQPYWFVPCDLILPCAWKSEDFGWRPPSTLLEVGGSDGSDPKVAAFDSGAISAWRKYQAGVWSSVFTKAGGWTAPVQVTPGSTQQADKVVVAGAVDGSAAVVLWLDNASSRTTVMASRWSGSQWSAPVVVDVVAGGSSDDPQVVLDALGNAVIAWQQGGRIKARRCPAGPLTGCGAPTPLENSSGDAGFPRLAGAPNGDAVVVWRDTAAVGGAHRIYANRYLAGTGAWDAGPALLGDGSSFNEGPDVAMDPRGKATAVWSRDEAGKTNVYASRLE